ncbi:MAG: FtsW/RodA/SpoVE family cell cycle protein, partial [Lachnospiraceae bacterium]|nr:FtsW/RodA/SpoVE family cell cycle protein [Lachnospiraceae bacterium]
AASIVLLFLVRFSPLGMKINGARRWLRVGPFSFQPAEVSKLAVIIFVPVLIIKLGKKFRGLRGCARPFGAGLLEALCVYILTSNLSSAFIIMIITCAIIFVAHPDTGRLIAVFLCGLGAVGALAALLIFAGAISDFRTTRILVWLHPENYSTEGGYQIMQSLYAIGSGGFFGKGLGNGIQKLYAVPEAENDMIFSIICEELGVFGGVIVMLLFIYLLYRLLIISGNAPDLYGCLMVSGVMAHIAIQVILNICVVTNAIPTTGVTLPFVSYGGTSLFFLMMEIAVALAVSRRIKTRIKERDLWGEIAQPVIPGDAD